ncbi:hypothetical protein FKW77_001558 [Venturia effusa]|uniref:Nephrocystin 3-like N-terminal domain-containing protein n=1 Tax=Venturia effusa TaxID=50376 RepID=A0A517LQU1_9PEZI|nr:hypothetical protein FKW77_001558 [Venturia effusa]
MEGKKLNDMFSGFRRGFLSGRGLKSRESKTPTPSSAQGSSSMTSEVPSRFGLFPFTQELTEEQVKSGGVDIIAVHGINGDYEHTWTHKKNGTLWLRDLLLNDTEIPANTRVFSYGYDSLVYFSHSTAKKEDYARGLLQALKGIRKKNMSSRPLIFICHSMGGLVVKQALVELRLHEPAYPDIQSFIKAIFFLSTPHRGSDVTEWAELLAHLGEFVTLRTIGGFRSDLIQSLRLQSDDLRTLSNNWRDQAGSIKILSFIETVADSRVKKRVVDEHTGLLGFPGESYISMDNCNHSEVCRFPDALDQNYRNIKNELVALIDSFASSSDSTIDGCLSSLFFPEMNERRDTVEGPLQGTCEWIYDNSDFKSWRISYGLLWIKGSPGAGKSTLMKSLVRHFEDEMAKSGTLVLSYFFHGRGSEAQRSPLYLLRSLLHQLLKARPIQVELQNSSDIHRYIEGQLAEFPSADDKVGAMIRDRAQGIFQWVVLVVDKVIALARKGKTSRSIAQAVDQLPQSLAELYDSLLRTLDDEDKSISARLFLWVIYAEDPLSLPQLNQALQCDPDAPNDVPGLKRRLIEARSESDEVTRLRVRSLSCGLMQTQA